MKNIVNFLFFQVGWFSCVLGAAHGYLLAGPIVVCILFAAHLLINKPLMLQEIIIGSCAMLCGIFFDTLCIALGVYVPVRYLIPDPYIPLWFLALWLNFGITINFSLKVFSKSLALAAVLGGVGGPLAYYAGEKFGAISFGVLEIHPLIVIGVGWAITLPVLFITAKVVNRKYSKEREM
jgi:hypothetical protein